MLLTSDPELNNLLAFSQEQEFELAKQFVGNGYKPCSNASFPSTEK